MSSLPKTLIQKMRDGSDIMDIETDFGFVTKELPFPLSVEVKDIESSDFLDENGVDEPEQSKLFVKAYDMDVTFATKGTKTKIYENYKSFRDYLLGTNGDGTLVSIYSEYNGIGRQNIRLKKLDDSAEYVDLGDDQYMLVIKAQFTVNDPLTDVIINYGSASGSSGSSSNLQQ